METIEDYKTQILNDIEEIPDIYIPHIYQIIHIFRTQLFITKELKINQLQEPNESENFKR